MLSGLGSGCPPEIKVPCQCLFIGVLKSCSKQSMLSEGELFGSLLIPNQKDICSLVSH